MVVSWTFKVGWPDTRDNSAAAPPPRTDGMPYRRGDRAAINIANALNKGEEKMIYGLGYRVFISNGVDHGEGAYAGMAEYDAVKLRFANQPGMPIALTTAMIQSRYGEGVSRAQAAQLRRLEI
jgi:hypothetical protein